MMGDREIERSKTLRVNHMMTIEKIAWGWDGVIAKRELARAAHIKWFDFMIKELKDESLKQYIGSPDYFNAVLDITARFAGVKREGNEDLLSTIARNFYEGFYLSESKGKERIWPGVKEVIYELNEGKHYESVIVSGTPNEAVRAIVNDEDLKVYPANIFASKIAERPRGKNKFLREFVQDQPKPKLYVGDGVKDIKTAKGLEIYAVLASWDRTPDYTGKFRQEEFEEASKLADKIIEKPEEVLELIK